MLCEHSRAAPLHHKHFARVHVHRDARLTTGPLAQRKSNRAVAVRVVVTAQNADNYLKVFLQHALHCKLYDLNSAVCNAVHPSRHVKRVLALGRLCVVVVRVGQVTAEDKDSTLRGGGYA